MTITIKDDYVIFEEEIKKSRFICQLKRVYTEDEAREFIQSVKKEHYKATHNVSAFTLGDKQEIQRSSDDGEPTGTAGIPMLEILKKRGIVNVVAVVTRYFGGTKLGAGGLIRAYGGAVAHALDGVDLVKKIEQQEVAIVLDYALYDSFNRFLGERGLEFASPEFTTEVKGSIFVDLDAVDQELLEIENAFSGRVNTQKLDKRFVEVTL
ncbi:YigZ family protein [Streptococcaceae bacterium ESL0729]|nr:YigZ family protein [Streptococcaceae bacterium ESL0729]